MIVACAFVLLMTPGLAFFYGGMVNIKNIISTMLQSFVALARSSHGTRERSQDKPKTCRFGTKTGPKNGQDAPKSMSKKHMFWETILEQILFALASKNSIKVDTLSNFCLKTSIPKSADVLDILRNHQNLGVSGLIRFRPADSGIFF